MTSVAAVSPSTVTSSRSNHRPTIGRTPNTDSVSSAIPPRACGAGRSRDGNVDASCDADAHVGQRPAALAPSFMNLDRRRPDARIALVYLPDRHQLLGVRERQRPQDDRVQNTEDRARGADAERQSQHRRECESRALPQQSPSPAQIEAEVYEPAAHSYPPVRAVSTARGTLARILGMSASFDARRAPEVTAATHYSRAAARSPRAVTLVQ